MTSGLHLRDEETARSWRVWPDPEAIPPGAVHELGRYLFELHEVEDAQAVDLLIDGVALEALRSKNASSAKWRWQPGFHAGVVEAEIKLPGGSKRRFELVTDPDLKKLTRDHFDSMVREILEDSFALFSLSGFRRAVARGTDSRKPAIARLEFLRSRIDELERVVHAITQGARRRLLADEVALPYYRASHATGPEIIRSMRGGRVLHESGNKSRLPATLQGCLPAKIRTRQKLNTTDLLEHRQIGACLRSWSAWLTSAGEQLSRRRKEDSELANDLAVWVARCQQLSRRINRLAGDPIFNHGAPSQPGLTLSAVFKNDAKYRAFYRLWQDMNRGIAAVFGDFLDMPLARTWELYELWCFLRLLRGAVVEFGVTGFDAGTLFKLDAAGGLTISATAAVVPVGGGWKLCFQRRFREFWIEADGRGSFSRTMTPDIVATGPATVHGGKERLLVLDAKYRIDEGLNDAISSIHTYRDALVREIDSGQIEGIVSAAYLLTPHVFTDGGGGGYRNVAMPGRLFRPDYRSTFRFGAVTLRPGLTIPELGQVLRQLVIDANWQ